jgi:hypothetical protein
MSILINFHVYKAEQASRLIGCQVSHSCFCNPHKKQGNKTTGHSHMSQVGMKISIPVFKSPENSASARLRLLGTFIISFHNFCHIFMRWIDDS